MSTQIDPIAELGRLAMRDDCPPQLAADILWKLVEMRAGQDTTVVAPEPQSFVEPEPEPTPEPEPAPEPRPVNAEQIVEQWKASQPKPSDDELVARYKASNPAKRRRCPPLSAQQIAQIKSDVKFLGSVRLAANRAGVSYSTALAISKDSYVRGENGKRMTEKDVEDVLKAGDDMTLTELAELIGTSQTTIRSILTQSSMLAREVGKRLGIEPRELGTVDKNRIDVHDATILADHQNGVRIGFTAKKLGLSQGTVSRYRKRLGLID